MKRWFVLWEDKTLQYFKDRGDDRPKNTIDLSRCEFLDTNLSDKKYKNIFSIRIQSRSDRDSGRTYYLSADSPYEMQTWIEKICNLCDFKAKENNNNHSGMLLSTVLLQWYEIKCIFYHHVLLCLYSFRKQQSVLFMFWQELLLAGVAATFLNLEKMFSDLTNQNGNNSLIRYKHRFVTMQSSIV